jgi:hypothetical protein
MATPSMAIATMPALGIPGTSGIAARKNRYNLCVMVCWPSLLWEIAMSIYGLVSA